MVVTARYEFACLLVLAQADSNFLKNVVVVEITPLGFEGQIFADDVLIDRELFENLAACLVVKLAVEQPFRQGGRQIAAGVDNIAVDLGELRRLYEVALFEMAAAYEPEGSRGLPRR